MDELDGIVDFSPPVDDPVAFQPSSKTREVPIPRFNLPGEPEGYRLPPAPTADKSTERPPVHAPIVSFYFATWRQAGVRAIDVNETQRFWFSTRQISSLGLTSSPIYPHILQLQIQPSAISRLFARLVRLLPNVAQRAVHRILPEWFLPDHVILKSQKRPNQDLDEADARELFDTELKAYNQL
jgi:hypothetical protein